MDNNAAVEDQKVRIGFTDVGTGRFSARHGEELGDRNGKNRSVSHHVSDGMDIHQLLLIASESLGRRSYHHHIINVSQSQEASLPHALILFGMEVGMMSWVPGTRSLTQPDLTSCSFCGSSYNYGVVILYPMRRYKEIWRNL